MNNITHTLTFKKEIYIIDMVITKRNGGVSSALHEEISHLLPTGFAAAINGFILTSTPANPGSRTVSITAKMDNLDNHEMEQDMEYCKRTSVAGLMGLSSANSYPVTVPKTYSATKAKINTIAICKFSIYKF